MAASDGFKQSLREGKLVDALKLALSEAIELKVTTWVASEVPNGNGQAVSTGGQPGHRMQTRLNIVDGDINNEVGSAFLNNGPYSELRNFHLKQVQEGRETIRHNLSNLQKLVSLFAKALKKDDQAFISEPEWSDAETPALQPAPGPTADLTADPLSPLFDDRPADLTADPVLPISSGEDELQPSPDYGYEPEGYDYESDGDNWSDGFEPEPMPMGAILPDEFKAEIEFDEIPADGLENNGFETWEDVPVDIPDEDGLYEPELMEATDASSSGGLDNLSPDGFSPGIEPLEDIVPDEFSDEAALLEDIAPDELSAGAELLEDIAPDELQSSPDLVDVPDAGLDDADPLADFGLDDGIEVLSDAVGLEDAAEDAPTELDLPEAADPLVASGPDDLGDAWGSEIPVELTEEISDLDAGSLEQPDLMVDLEDEPLGNNWEEPLSLEMPEEMPELNNVDLGESPEPMPAFEVDPLASDAWDDPLPSSSNDQFNLETELDPMADLNQFADSWEEEDEDETVMNLPDSDSDSIDGGATDPMAALFDEVPDPDIAGSLGSEAVAAETADPLAALFGETPSDPSLSLYETEGAVDPLLNEDNPFADFPGEAEGASEAGEENRWADLDDDLDSAFSDESDSGLTPTPPNW